MGEIADMMLDGTLCEQCGEFLGDPPGYPQTCGSCGAHNGSPSVKEAKAAVPTTPKVNCPKCGKRLKQAGLNDHMRDVHKFAPFS